MDARARCVARRRGRGCRAHGVCGARLNRADVALARSDDSEHECAAHERAAAAREDRDHLNPRWSDDGSESCTHGHVHAAGRCAGAVARASRRPCLQSNALCTNDAMIEPSPMPPRATRKPPPRRRRSWRERSSSVIPAKWTAQAERSADARARARAPKPAVSLDGAHEERASGAASAVRRSAARPHAQSRRWREK